MAVNPMGDTEIRIVMPVTGETKIYGYELKGKDPSYVLVQAIIALAVELAMRPAADHDAMKGGETHGKTYHVEALS